MSSVSLVFYSNVMPMAGTSAKGSYPMQALPSCLPLTPHVVYVCSLVPESPHNFSEPQTLLLILQFTSYYIEEEKLALIFQMSSNILFTLFDLLLPAKLDYYQYLDS